MGFARYFIFKRLSPTIETQLTNLINRPVNLGEVKSFSLNGVRLGYSELPATEDETDQVLLEGVVVNFSLWPLLTQRKLNLDITLLKPQIYIEQDIDNVWVALDIQDDDDDDGGGIKVDVNNIYLKNADLTARSRMESGTLQTPIEITVPYGKGKLVQNDEAIDFDLEGTLKRGGTLGVTGIANLTDSSFSLDLRAKKLQISTVTDLLPLPFTLAEGLVDGQLAMNLAPGGELTDWQGEVITEGTTLILPQLVKPIKGMDSKITFEEQRLDFTDLSGSLGKVDLAGEMNLDLSGSIEGKLISQPVTIGDLLTTFELDAPEFVLDGQLRALVSVTGALEEPQLFIDAVNYDTLTFDRITFDQFQGTLAIIGSQFFVENFVATPTLGGQFQGQGLIQMPTEAFPEGAIAINTTGTQLPTNALAQLYEIPTPVPLGTGQGDFVFEATVDKVDQFVVSGSAVIPVAGGLVTATNLKVTQERWQTPATARGLRLNELYTQPLPPFAENSLVNGEFDATGALSPDAADPDPLQVTGQARTTLAGGTAIANNLRVKDGLWKTDISLEGLELNRLAPDLPPVAATYSGEFVAAGMLDNPSADAIDAAGAGRLTIADGGVIRTENVAIAKGEWYSRAEVDNVNLVNFSPLLGNYVSTVPTNGSFEVRGVLDNIALEAVLAQGQAVSQLAGGRVESNNITLQQGEFASQMVAMGVALFPFSEQMTGFGSGEFAVIADAINPDLSRLQVQGEARFSEGLSLIESPLRSKFTWTGSQLQIQEAIATGFSANGLVDINTARLETDPLAAIENVGLNLNLANFELAGLPLPPNARSLTLAGQTSFVGTVQGAPLQPQVDGSLRFNNLEVGDLIFENQIEGSIQTRSDRRLLIALEGESDRLIARLNKNLRPEQAVLQVADTSLDVAVQYGTNQIDPKQLRLTTKNFPVTLAKAIAQDQPQVQQIDFPLADIPMDGRISSELTADLQNLSASGRLIVDSPTVGVIRGDRLNGDFYYGNNQLVLRDMAWRQQGSLYAVNTTINLPNDNSQPTIALTGQVEQGRIEDILVAMQLFDYSDFQNLGKLSLPDYFGKSSIFGDSQDLYDTVDLVNPRDFPKEVITLNVPADPKLIQPDNDTRPTTSCRELLNRNTSQSQDPNTLFVRNSQDLSFAERAALINCVQTKIALNDREASKTLLPAQLADLRGAVNGQFTLNLDSEANLEADFDLRGGYQEITELGETTLIGRPWQWGAIEIPYVVARGVLRNNVLTLRPINIQLPDGQVIFIGSFGGETQSGQLRLNEIPVAFLQKFVDLPEAVGLQGSINASANLAGTPKDPSARGEMSMTNARINDAEISAVTGNFAYENAHLDFTVDGELLEGVDPLTVVGSIPYQLPNTDVAPDSNELKLTFNLKDEGFILLNILSRGQLAWLDGQGQMDLTIDGEIDPETGRPEDLIAQGQVAIADAEIQAKTLPDAPLTDVNAKIDFNFDNFTIRELTGDFSGGEVDISGTLPIAQANAEENLNVKLNDLNFVLPDLYEGGVNGDLTIAGSALEPIIGGDINLSEGRIFLVDNQQQVAVTPQGTTNTKSDPKTTDTKQLKQSTKIVPSPAAPNVDLTALTEFRDLRITLGKNIQITRSPILNFLATGDMLFNGTLIDPKPSGIIELKRGQVNLFATQFRLDKGNKNTATFIPSLGLDPYLDVALQASLVETPQSSLINTDPLSAEVQDNSVFSATQIGTIETIRVRAKVEGQASQLDNSVELSSSPPRSETELVALLGGTLLDSFTSEGTDSGLALANLAGSALLNTVQDTIGNALGLSELRLFPTVIADDEEDRNTTLGLGAELGIDITPSFSFSLLQILNSSETTQFGIRYRLNDEIFIRGSTNLSDDSRLTVEYDLKF
ncbi:translocation/assembly module TamB domain-containing protein [[Leptolyngbya] sp. PCC 7376]|uniref:translocation/assembly module TamB domain-containing protein n=1 Tax=[Leptolyngbya] sp. PCC 7376 TaxID=111781 RepID=UPI0002EF59E0|nr:translocation/assembly module TamB domain-containing protein [[Leptolyngbya] sp. PCC 7376]